MITKLLNGNKLANEIKREIIEDFTKNILKKQKRVPHLGIIITGNKSSSIKYVNNKIKKCENIGIKHTLIKLPCNSTEKELLTEINNMNINPLIDGFIVQLPLEKHINKNKIILSINPNKDVDGFHPENLGKMILGINGFIPATALGIITLLKRNKLEISGKHTVIIGRSITVGRPISILMNRKNIIGNSTVTVIHSKTKNIEFYTKQADILIVSVGIPKFITGKMIKKGAIVIDVGINHFYYKNSISTIFGDVDFKSVYGIASYITPVPGGIGPMTVIMLLKNTLKAALNNR